MDPVSHGLFGSTLGLAMRRPRPAGLIAAFVLGSFLPDIDGALAFRGFDVYLRTHAAGTHALVSTPIEAAVLAALLRLMIRRARYGPLMLASWAGVLGHIFWDFAGGSDMAVFAPFSARVFGLHLVTMWDPFVIAALLVPLVIAWRRPARTRAGTAAAAVVLAALLSAKMTSQGRAWSLYERVAGRMSPAAPARISPVLGSLFGWTIFDRTGDRVRAWAVDARTGSVTSIFDRPDAPASSMLLASRDLPAVRTFLELDGIPFARLERDGEKTLVLWSDARRCSATTCDVSFGAAFEKNPKPLYQIVRVGTFEQRRALDR